MLRLLLSCALLALPAAADTFGLPPGPAGPGGPAPNAGPNDPIIGLPPDPGTGNCFPFGCGVDGQYQQVYTHSQFSGPITISEIDFFNTQATTSATGMNSGSFTISLSTTSVDWNTITTNFAGNLGADNTTVFSGNLAQAWAFGDTLRIMLSTPFTYNPALGNLLLTVDTSGINDADGEIFFDTNGYNGGSFNGDTIMGRAVLNQINTGEADHGYGLVTGFVEASVPEPASLLLLGSALALVAGVIRKRLVY